MRVSDFMLSEGLINLQDQQKTAIVGPLNILTPHFIPGTVNVAMTIGFDEIEPGDYFILRAMDDANNTLIELPKVEFNATIEQFKSAEVGLSAFVNGNIADLVIRNDSPIHFVIEKGGNVLYERVYRVHAKEKI